MPSTLPDYDPPSAQRANVAAGLAPLLVLLAFVLIVARVLQPDTGFAIFAACTVWVVYELHVFQSQIDTYNAQYVRAHLAWRSLAALREFAVLATLAPATRDFVCRFLLADRVLLRDGQLP